MASITLTPSEQEIQSFLVSIRRLSLLVKSLYPLFFLRFPQATVSIYTSEKSSCRAKLLSSTPVSLATKFNKENSGQDFPMIGTDEVEMVPTLVGWLSWLPS